MSELVLPITKKQLYEYIILILGRGVGTKGKAASDTVLFRAVQARGFISNGRGITLMKYPKNCRD